MGIELAKKTYEQYGWITHVRPMIIGALIADILSPERRTIIENSSSLKFYVDPLNNLGSSLLKYQVYESETEAIIRGHLFKGESFLDVGANEGYFSVLAASIVGAAGYVASVEPQSRLCDIIRINLALNGAKGNIFNAALGGAKDEYCHLHLYPSLNTGASGVFRKPRLYRKSETAIFADPLDVLGNQSSLACVKVDVEGYEGAVVKSLLPLLQGGQIRTLLIDYHDSILQAFGINPVAIERAILDSGMSLEISSSHYSGYRLYIRK